jgi:membrane protein DedA with SNARE-associated domain
MGLGISPFAAYLAWVMVFFATFVPGRRPVMPILDPVGMVGLAMATYAGALGVAGPAAWWSWSLARAVPALRSRPALVFQCLVALLLACPFIWSFGQTLCLG